MDNSSYIILSRHSGLNREFTSIAHNLANANTTGFKRERAIFSEYIVPLTAKDINSREQHSVSIGRLSAHTSDLTAGSMRSTGGALDVAIDGHGFFLVDVDGNTLLTRAGHFMSNAEGILVNADGHAVLDPAEGEIQIPPEAAHISISKDGVISADNVEISRLGVVDADPLTLSRRGANNWAAANGTVAVENPSVAQGFLEDSNIEPVLEIARMIAVQRYYEAGQKLMDMEHERIKQVITTIKQSV